MITMLIIIGVVLLLGAVFGLAFSITGAVLTACFWVLKLPIVLVMWAIGVVCCCMILLIPLGLLLFKTGSAMLIC